MKINVVSSMCGTGKSTYILNQLTEWNKEKLYDQFVYISPLLSEVGGDQDIEGNYINGRVQRECKDMNFRYPIRKSAGGKGEHVRQLLSEGNNISATHSLFLDLEDDDIQLFKERKNVLVIDEAVSAFQEFGGVSRVGVALLLANDNLIVNEDNTVSWNHNKFPVDVDRENPKFGGRPFEYKELVQLCNRGHIHLVQGTVIVWEFPMSVLEAFDEVYVLTYLFQGSFMHSWCKLNNVEVNYLSPDLHRSNEEVKAFVKEHLTIADAPPLRVLDKYTFSYTWWDNNNTTTVLSKVNKAIASYINNYLRGYTCEDYLFTYPKFLYDKQKIKGKGFTKAKWIAVQTRATNDYADKKVVFYLYDRYPNTTLSNFCISKDISIDKDLFAVSEVLQMVWRGCIRKGEPMIVVIPSVRMRRLFTDWVNDTGVFSNEE